MPTLGELSRYLECELVGSPDLEITGVASVECGGPGDIAPIDNRQFAKGAETSKAGAFLITNKLRDDLGRPCLRSEYPLADLNRIMDLLELAPRKPVPSIHPTAVIHPEADVGPGLHAGPYVVVDKGAKLGARCVLRAHIWIERGAVLGDDCIVEPGAAIYDGAEIGSRVRIGAQAVLSRQGFGYAPGPNGPVHLYHVGRVIIEDDVNLGAGVMIDRARFDETRIGRFSKLDSLIHVGHNSRIGARTFVAAQTGLAGNAKIGDDCYVGGQVGIANHCGVGDRCRVGAKTGFMKMFGDDTVVMGYPAHVRVEWLRQQAILRRLAREGRDAES